MREAPHVWILCHPRVVNSRRQLANETLLVKDEAAGKKVRVGKLLRDDNGFRAHECDFVRSRGHTATAATFGRAHTRYEWLQANRGRIAVCVGAAPQAAVRSRLVGCFSTRTCCVIFDQYIYLTLVEC